MDLLPKVEPFFGFFLWQQAVGLFGWKGTIIYPIIKSNTIAGVPMQVQAEVDSWMKVLKRVVGVSVRDLWRCWGKWSICYVVLVLFWSFNLFILLC